MRRTRQSSCPSLRRRQHDGMPERSSVSSAGMHDQQHPTSTCRSRPLSLMVMFVMLVMVTMARAEDGGGVARARTTDSKTISPSGTVRVISDNTRHNTSAPLVSHRRPQLPLINGTRKRRVKPSASAPFSSTSSTVAAVLETIGDRGDSHTRPGSAPFKVVRRRKVLHLPAASAALVTRRPLINGYAASDGVRHQSSVSRRAGAANKHLGGDGGGGRTSESFGAFLAAPFLALLKNSSHFSLQPEFLLAQGVVGDNKMQPFRDFGMKLESSTAVVLAAGDHWSSATYKHPVYHGSSDVTRPSTEDSVSVDVVDGEFDGAANERADNVADSYASVAHGAVDIRGTSVVTDRDQLADDKRPTQSRPTARKRHPATVKEEGGMKVIVRRKKVRVMSASSRLPQLSYNKTNGSPAAGNRLDKVATLSYDEQRDDNEQQSSSHTVQNKTRVFPTISDVHLTTDELPTSTTESATTAISGFSTTEDTFHTRSKGSLSTTASYSTTRRSIEDEHRASVADAALNISRPRSHLSPLLMRRQKSSKHSSHFIGSSRDRTDTVVSHNFSSATRQRAGFLVSQLRLSGNTTVDVADDPVRNTTSGRRKSSPLTRHRLENYRTRQRERLSGGSSSPGSVGHTSPTPAVIVSREKSEVARVLGLVSRLRHRSRKQSSRRVLHGKSRPPSRVNLRQNATGATTQLLSSPKASITDTTFSVSSSSESSTTTTPVRNFSRNATTTRDYQGISNNSSPQQQMRLSEHLKHSAKVNINTDNKPIADSAEDGQLKEDTKATRAPLSDTLRSLVGTKDPHKHPGAQLQNAEPRINTLPLRRASSDSSNLLARRLQMRHNMSFPHVSSSISAIPSAATIETTTETQRKLFTLLPLGSHDHISSSPTENIAASESSSRKANIRPDTYSTHHVGVVNQLQEDVDILGSKESIGSKSVKAAVQKYSDLKTTFSSSPESKHNGISSDHFHAGHIPSSTSNVPKVYTSTSREYLTKLSNTLQLNPKSPLRGRNASIVHYSVITSPIYRANERIPHGRTTEIAVSKSSDREPSVQGNTRSNIGTVISIFSSQHTNILASRDHIYPSPTMESIVSTTQAPQSSSRANLKSTSSPAPPFVVNTTPSPEIHLNRPIVEVTGDSLLKADVDEQLFEIKLALEEQRKLEEEALKSSSRSTGPLYLVSLLFVIPVVAVAFWYLKNNQRDIYRALPQCLRTMLWPTLSGAGDECGEDFYCNHGDDCLAPQLSSKSTIASDTVVRRRCRQIPRQCLRLQHMLGEGHFGQVWKAEADISSSHDAPLIVAVKNVKDAASSKERQDLMRELRIMMQLGSHPNVVTLLGCCTESEPTLLVMEYVAFGKLLAYLRENRGRHTYYSLNHDSSVLTSRDLTVFAYQVAAAMEYISSKQIIHRDLAARNVLVDVDKTCKVCDFGMSRSFTEINTESFEPKHRGALPIRWMSPESLTYNTYNQKTDCWSYGILLWEIITLGSTPYPGLSAREVMCAVREGERLQRPDHCQPQLYQLAASCWAAEAALRPDFTQLRHQLQILLVNESRGYVDLDRFQEEIYATLNKSSDERV